MTSKTTTTASAASETLPPAAKLRLDSWGWGQAFLAVFLILLFAWGIGIPLRRVFVEGTGSALHVFSLATGSIAAASFLALSARRAVEFLLSVRVGIAVIVVFLLGSIVSVVAHPRDPEKYLHLPTIEQRERAQRDDFAWATAFFVYHLAHPYGIGLPSFEPPPGAETGLERIARRYGDRIAKQEESGMRTALSGTVRSQEIRQLIEEHRGLFDGLYEACFFLQLNGTTTGKGAWTSDWFTAAMVLLFVMVATNTFRRGAARAIALGAPGFGFLRHLPSALWWDLKSLVSLARIGFLVTHLGVLTSLVGGLWSRVTEERGIVQLSIDPMREGSPRQSSSFRTYSNVPRPFGSGESAFEVRLADFRADYRDTLDVEFLGDPAPKTFPRYRTYEVWDGRQIGLEYGARPTDADGEGAGPRAHGSSGFRLSGHDRPSTVVRVLEHWHRAEVGFDLVERPEGEGPANSVEAIGPALKLAIAANGEPMLSLFLFAGRPDLAEVIDLPAVRVRLQAARDAESQRELATAPFEGETYGTLEVWTSDEAARPAVSVELRGGAVFELDLPSGKITGTVLRALPDARLMATPQGTLEPQFAGTPAQDLPPTHPGAEIELRAENGKSRRVWVFADPADSPFGDEGLVQIGRDKARFLVHSDPWRAPARKRFRLVTAPGLPILFAEVGTSRLEQLEVGQSALLGGGVSLRIDRRADRPRLVPLIEPVPGDADSDEVFFDASRPGAVRVEVEGPEGKQEFRLAARPFADAAVYGGRIRLRLFENRNDLPREWKSRLEFLETRDGESKIVDSGTIRVNDYHTFRGYRFFQTDANPRFPGYSGVGIVKDPGIETVLLGMWGIVIGVAYAFLVKPLLIRRAAP